MFTTPPRCTVPQIVKPVKIASLLGDLSALLSARKAEEEAARAAAAARRCVSDAGPPLEPPPPARRATEENAPGPKLAQHAEVAAAAVALLRAVEGETMAMPPNAGCGGQRARQATMSAAEAEAEAAAAVAFARARLAAAQRTGALEFWPVVAAAAGVAEPKRNSLSLWAAGSTSNLRPGGA